MSEIKLNPKLDLDLPTDPTPAATIDPASNIQTSIPPLTSPAPQTMSFQTLDASTAVNQVMTPETQNIGVDTNQVSVSDTPQNGKQMDMVMIVSFLLFLVSLGAAGYFLYQYFK